MRILVSLNFLFFKKLIKKNEHTKKALSDKII